MKFVTLAAAPKSMSSEQFAAWFKEEHLPKLPEAAGMFSGGLVRTRVDPLHGQGLSGMGWTGPIPDASEIPSCDVLMEFWLPSGEDFRREILPGETRLRDIGATFSSYAVAPHLRKDPRITEAGPNGKRPELTFISTVKWLPAITRDVAQREWEDHTAIALRSQPALTKYEQNFVTETISWSEGSPTIDAFGDFAFATTEDLLQRFRVSIEEIQDACQFVGLSDVSFFGDAEPFGVR